MEELNLTVEQNQVAQNQVAQNQVAAQTKFMFKLNLPDVLRLTMFGTLIAIINDITRLPLHLPGHTSILWMGILLLGRGLIPEFGGGIIMGIVSGVLAVFLGLGSEGVFVFFKYFVPGVLLDLLAPAFKNKLASPLVGAICGIFASLAKMLVNILLGLILKIPMVFLTIGLGFTAVCHVLFGAIGGLLAAFLIKQLKPRLANWQ